MHPKVGKPHTDVPEDLANKYSGGAVYPFR